jgi:hypothetical protein
VGCSDGFIQRIYPVHLLVIVILISKQKVGGGKAKWCVEGGWEGGGVKKTCSVPGDSVTGIWKLVNFVQL